MLIQIKVCVSMFVRPEKNEREREQQRRKEWSRPTMPNIPIMNEIAVMTMCNKIISHVFDLEAGYISWLIFCVKFYYKLHEI